jgi:hypothetical protein
MSEALKTIRGFFAWHGFLVGHRLGWRQAHRLLPWAGDWLYRGERMEHLRTALERVDEALGYTDRPAPSAEETR